MPTLCYRFGSDIDPNMIERIQTDPRYKLYEDRLTLGVVNFSDLGHIAMHQAFPELFKAPRRKN